MTAPASLSALTRLCSRFSCSTHYRCPDLRSSLVKQGFSSWLTSNPFAILFFLASTREVKVDVDDRVPEHRLSLLTGESTREVKAGCVQQTLSFSHNRARLGLRKGYPKSGTLAY